MGTKSANTWSLLWRLLTFKPHPSLCIFCSEWKTFQPYSFKSDVSGDLFMNDLYWFPFSFLFQYFSCAGCDQKFFFCNDWDTQDCFSILRYSKVSSLPWVTFTCWATLTFTITADQYSYWKEFSWRLLHKLSSGALVLVLFGAVFLHCFLAFYLRQELIL